MVWDITQLERFGFGFDSTCLTTARVISTPPTIEELAQIRKRISDSKKFQQWAFNALQKQVECKSEQVGIVAENVEPTMLEMLWMHARRKPRWSALRVLILCGYATNTDYNAAKNVALARNLLVTLQQRQGQKSVAGEAFCQYALNSGIVTVSASKVTSNTFVSVERESINKPTASAVGS
ncbi:transposase [Haloquadratum walsbyi]|jgi:hypothetical protein|uniref:Transposase n=1 Tax=Haloquadratum walsbyi J07HQW2 TaxID=1238425 RepID=U1MVX8_9EURY|nr:transposase [Haloquadratum walsbyi]ERG94574.1 MAG: hypothetical protein J07HQW2_01010 [Haloquadratum walsbyi J07HQW2]